MQLRATQSNSRMHETHATNKQMQQSNKQMQLKLPENVTCVFIGCTECYTAVLQYFYYRYTTPRLPSPAKLQSLRTLLSILMERERF